MGSENYGGAYWGVKVTTDISPDGEIYLMADEVIVSQAGALEFIRKKTSSSNLVIAPGKWLTCFAASLFDGHAVAVEYWKGEVNRYGDTEVESSGHGARSKERNKVTKSLRYDVLKRDSFTCRSCGANGKESRLEVDHITPVSKGGKSELSNLQTLCQDCNGGKGDRE
jgi:hypothetical protein